jgi:hypothetical protein
MIVVNLRGVDASGVVHAVDENAALTATGDVSVHLFLWWRIKGTASTIFAIFGDIRTMRHARLRILPHLCLLLGSSLTLVAGEDADRAFRDGLTAFNEGAYANAAAALDPLAEAGEARAQISFGFMYYPGRSMTHDSVRTA